MNTQNKSSNNDIQPVGSEPTREEKFVTPSSIEQYEKIVDRAHREIDRVHIAYTRYIRILGTILVVGIAVASFLTWDNAREMRSEMKDNITDMSNRVNKRIEDEFSKESIQELIRNEAKEIVSKVVGETVNDYATNTLEPKLKMFNEKISGTESRLNKLESEAIDDLRNESEYILTVIAAKYGERNAFEKLKKLTGDESSMFSKRAAKAVEGIMDQATWPSPIIYNTSIPDNINLSNLSFDQYRSLYSSASMFERFWILGYIQERKDIPKKDKMEFLLEIMKTDDNLQVVDYAGCIFLEESKQNNVKPLEIDKMFNWWEENKDEYHK